MNAGEPRPDGVIPPPAACDTGLGEGEFVDIQGARLDATVSPVWRIMRCPYCPRSRAAIVARKVPADGNRCETWNAVNPCVHFVMHYRVWLREAASDAGLFVLRPEDLPKGRSKRPRPPRSANPDKG